MRIICVQAPLSAFTGGIHGSRLSSRSKSRSRSGSDSGSDGIHLIWVSDATELGVREGRPLVLRLEILPARDLVVLAAHLVEDE